MLVTLTLLLISTANCLPHPQRSVVLGMPTGVITEPPLKLVLFENQREKGKLNHLGIEVESSEKVAQVSERLKQAELTVKAENQTTCCYAKQDKVWVTDPDGDDWEVYAVLEENATFACGGTQTTAN